MTSLQDSPPRSQAVDDQQQHQYSSVTPADGLSWKTGYSPTTLPAAMTSSTDGFENVSFTVDLYDPPFAAPMNSDGNWCLESSQSGQQLVVTQQQQLQQQHPLDTKQPVSLIDQLKKQADAKAATTTRPLDEDLTAVFVPHMVFSCIIMLTVVGTVFGCFAFAFAVIAACNDEQGRPEKSKMWSRASFVCSSVGFLSFLAVVITIMVLVLIGLIYTDPE